MHKQKVSAVNKKTVVPRGTTVFLFTALTFCLCTVSQSYVIIYEENDMYYFGGTGNDSETKIISEGHSVGSDFNRLDGA